MRANPQVYRALEKQRISARDTPNPLPAPTTGGFPKAEFFTSVMPRLPPDLAPPSPLEDSGVGSGGGVISGGDEGIVGGRAVNVLAMERLGENLMALSQVCVFLILERTVPVYVLLICSQHSFFFLPNDNPVHH